MMFPRLATMSHQKSITFVNSPIFLFVYNSVLTKSYSHHTRYHLRNYPCQHPGCGKRFGTKTHLDRHINDKHEKSKRYHCIEPTCAYSREGGKAFPRKDNWRRHMTNIHKYPPSANIQADVVDLTVE